MPKPKADSETADDAEKQDVLPHWVKVSGAVIGIVATVATIFTGIFTLVREYQKEQTAQAIERTQQAVERFKEAKERSEQLRIEAKIKQDEHEARLAQIQAQIDIETEKARQQELTRDAAQLEIQRQIRQDERQDLNREKDELAMARKQLLEAIANLPSGEATSMGTLLTISRYAEIDEESRGLAIRSLAAYADRTCSPTELSIIFSTLRQMGAPSLGEVAILNRNAFRSFTRALRDSFLWQLHEGVPDDLAPVAGANQPAANDAANEPPDLRFRLCHSIRSTTRLTEILSSEVQAALLMQFIQAQEKATLGRSEYPRPRDDRETVAKKLACSAEVLAASTGFLARGLKVFPPDPSVDLTDTYIELEDPQRGFAKADYQGWAVSSIDRALIWPGETLSKDLFTLDNLCGRW